MFSFSAQPERHHLRKSEEKSGTPSKAGEDRGETDGDQTGKGSYTLRMFSLVVHEAVGLNKPVDYSPRVATFFALEHEARIIMSKS